MAYNGKKIYEMHEIILQIIKSNRILFVCVGNLSISNTKHIIYKNLIQEIAIICTKVWEQRVAPFERARWLGPLKDYFNLLCLKIKKKWSIFTAKIFGFFFYTQC